jgi:hypothetical protein
MSREYVSRAWKYIGLASGIAWLVFFFAAVALWIRYDQTRPLLADPNVGRVYPLSTHGSVVYLVFAERLGLYGLIAVAIIVGVTTICIELLKGPFRLRR